MTYELEVRLMEAQVLLKRAEAEESEAILLRNTIVSLMREEVFYPSIMTEDQMVYVSDTLVGLAVYIEREKRRR